MSGVYGADVEQLRQLGRELSQQSEQLDSILGRLATRIDGVAWFGPDASRFRESWQADLSPKIRMASRNLADAGGSATKNAADQEAVSNSSGGGSSSGIGGFAPGGFTPRPDPRLPNDLSRGDEDVIDFDRWRRSIAPETLPFLDDWSRTMPVPLPDGFFPPQLEFLPMPFHPMPIEFPGELPIDVVRIPEPAPLWLDSQAPTVEPDFFAVPTPFEPGGGGREWLDGIALQPDGAPRGYVGRDDGGQMFLIRGDGSRDAIFDVPKHTPEDWGFPAYEGPKFFRVAGSES